MLRLSIVRAVATLTTQHVNPADWTMRTYTRMCMHVRLCVYMHACMSPTDMDDAHQLGLVPCRA